MHISTNISKISHIASGMPCHYHYVHCVDNSQKWRLAGWLQFRGMRRYFISCLVFEWHVQPRVYVRCTHSTFPQMCAHVRKKSTDIAFVALDRCYTSIFAQKHSRRAFNCFPLISRSGAAGKFNFFNNKKKNNEKERDLRSTFLHSPILDYSAA